MDANEKLDNVVQLMKNSHHRHQPPEPPDMEARIARLEAWGQHTDTTLTDIKQDVRDFKQDMRDFRQEMKDMRKDMRDDFRILFGAIIAVAIGLSGLMAKGFGWL